MRYIANSVPNLSLSQRDKLVEQRRAVGLCFKCRDKYTIGHQCKKQLLLLEGEEGEEEEEMVVIEDKEVEGKGAISLHAIKGMASSKIIKVEGKVQDNTFMVLIDSGSTHSFLNEGTAKRMKWPLANTQPL